MNGISFSVGLMGYHDANSIVTGAGGAAGVGDATKAIGHRSSPEECETCKTRKYQDGSDENVSFKAASHIAPESAQSAVRGHEQEHVSNAYTEAAQKGGKVINASVSIHTAVCPECGRTYVSGGTTSTLIKYPKDKEGTSADSTGRGQEENFSLDE